MEVQPQVGSDNWACRVVIEESYLKSMPVCTTTCFEPRPARGERRAGGPQSIQEPVFPLAFAVTNLRVSKRDVIYPCVSKHWKSDFSLRVPSLDQRSWKNECGRYKCWVSNDVCWLRSVHMQAISILNLTLTVLGRTLFRTRASVSISQNRQA